MKNRNKINKTTLFLPQLLMQAKIAIFFILCILICTLGKKKIIIVHLALSCWEQWLHRFSVIGTFTQFALTYFYSIFHLVPDIYLQHTQELFFTNKMGKNLNKYFSLYCCLYLSLMFVWRHILGQKLELDKKVDKTLTAFEVIRLLTANFR